MTQAEIDAILAEASKRAQAKSLITPPEALLEDADVFSHQRDFITHPAKLKALFCTRRSAKSFTAGLYLDYEALRTPGANCLFIGLTRDSAKSIIWKDILRVLDTKHGLGAKPNQTELSLTFPNSSVIKVTGVDADQEEMMKLLGRKYKLVCIDEASMYSVDLRNLVYGILKPAMVDQGGTICMMGTASNFPRGLFYDVTTKKEPGWQLFEWTAHDNPHVAKQWAEELEDIKINRPLYMETPQFRQWYLNEWVIDDEKLVYRFHPERNLIKQLPINLAPDLWTFVLGIDTGWEDDNAFVLTAFHQNDPHLYVVDTFAQRRWTFDQVAAKVIEYTKGERPPHKIVIDGANKQGVESMRQRYSLPFEYADKQDKVTFIELCNADLVQAKIKVLDTPRNRGLIDEMATLVWTTDGEIIKLPKKENPTLPNHRCDAFLYAWRNGFHYHWAPKEPKVIHGSRDWYLQQQIDWEKERDKLIEQEQSDWPTMADGW